MLSWLAFLKLMCLFILQKDLLSMRCEFILRFLGLTEKQGVSDLDKADHITERIGRFQFTRRSPVTPIPVYLAFWNRIREALGKERAVVFENGTLNMQNAVAVLLASGITSVNTHFFFDMLFDIA